MAGGRPTKYLPVFARMARKFGRRGFTRAEIAELLDVSIMSIWRWEAAYPEFREALRAGAAASDARVEVSLYERAVGQLVRREEVAIVKCGKDETRVEVVEVSEQLPAEVRAIELWLMNRKPEVWRPRRPVEEAPPPVQIIFHDPTQIPAGYARKRPAALIEGEGRAA